MMRRANGTFVAEVPSRPNLRTLLNVSEKLCYETACGCRRVASVISWAVQMRRR